MHPKPFIVLLAALTCLPVQAFARSALYSRLDFTAQNYRVRAELYFDRETRKPDLWVDYEERGHSDSAPVAFQATSIQSRLTDADWRLSPAPIAHIDGKVLLIYYGFNAKTGEYDGEHGLAVLQHYPLSELTDQTRSLITSRFPRSIIYDDSGNPKYIKGLLCRMTETQVYPIAAFDRELPL